jgi:dihydrofolate synthase/folylpolyglutamate synthase
MKLPFWPDPSNYHNIELGLDRTYQLLERLGNPHLRIPPTIHIAGTNGKGSTLAFLKAIFEDANLKVHCYTSPHLVNFNERIVLAGKEIGNDFLNEILQQCKNAAEIEPKIEVTFFEGITVAAFVAFAKIKADVLLLEVGMGGRLDSTNVIKNPIATIITPIDFDHTEFLGKTLSKIAFEKAGIIKPKVPVITSKQKPATIQILKEVAKKNKSRLIIIDTDFTNNIDLNLGLLGTHQNINAITAIATILTQTQFKISPQNIANGLQKVVWKARLQKIIDGKFYQILPKNFELILDGGHNKAGAKTILDWLKAEKKKSLKTKNYLVCAMLKDKDSEGFLRHLSEQIELLIGLKIKDNNNSKTANKIAQIAKGLDIESYTAISFSDAIGKIKKYHNKNYPNFPARIVISGSLYLAGEFLEENES